MKIKSVLTVLAFTSAAVASADVKITEWMYNGSEFVELTNVGNSTVDFSTYSFDDNTRTAGSQSLAGFGMVSPYESVILSEQSADAFRTQWNLPASVKVIGGNTNNLGRGDEINIYDGTTLVDRLTYDDQGTGPVKGPKTDVASANIALGDLGTNVAANAVVSKVGDAYGSYLSTTGNFVANPGKYTPVPEPASIAALGLGTLAFLRRRKR